MNKLPLPTDDELIAEYLALTHNKRLRAKLRSNKALDFKAIAKRRSNTKYQEKNKEKIKEQKAQYYQENKLKKQGTTDGKDKD